MTNEDADLYTGFYQGLAWAQGAQDAPLTFNVPDQLMRHSDKEPLEFSLHDFFTVVADLDDEGRIHLWEFDDPDGDTMRLHCTEDFTGKDIPDTALHAGAWEALSR